MADIQNSMTFIGLFIKKKKKSYYSMTYVLSSTHMCNRFYFTCKFILIILACLPWMDVNWNIMKSVGIVLWEIKLVIMGFISL